MTSCPLCGSPVERHTGLIEEPIMNPRRDGEPLRRKRLGTYDLCTACEWGEEWVGGRARAPRREALQ